MNHFELSLRAYHHLELRNIVFFFRSRHFFSYVACRSFRCSTERSTPRNLKLQRSGKARFLRGIGKRIQIFAAIRTQKAKIMTETLLIGQSLKQDLLIPISSATAWMKVRGTGSKQMQTVSIKYVCHLNDLRYVFCLFNTKTDKLSRKKFYHKS